jgi:hypothetical protein
VDAERVIASDARTQSTSSSSVAITGNWSNRSVLEQFPVIATENKETKDYEPEHALLSATTMEPIDLASWIIETTQSHHINDDEQQQIALTKSESESTSNESERTCTHLSDNPLLPMVRQPSASPMLQGLPPDYRSPAIQIGFNFE